MARARNRLARCTRRAAGTAINDHRARCCRCSGRARCLYQLRPTGAPLHATSNQHGSNRSGRGSLFRVQPESRRTGRRALALRYRLYSRFGLSASTITRIVGFSLLTNWIGYAALAGAAFASGLVELPDNVPISDAALRGLGVVLLLVVSTMWSRVAGQSGDAGACADTRSSCCVRGMAALHIVTSITHWSLIATVLYVMLQGKVGFVTVIGALMVSSVAGVITHIPAGLGVLEAVFVSLLSGAYPVNELLAALLAYRAVFYLGPLAIAGVAYILLELAARRQTQPSRRPHKHDKHATQQG